MQETAVYSFGNTVGGSSGPVPGASRSLIRRGSRVVLSATLAAALACMTPAAAFASDEETVASWVDAINAELADPTYQPYSFATSADAAASATDDSEVASTFPEKYDLRDPNGDGDRSDSVVTPVKMQDPWGTCWGFSIVAASEMSILSELGKTYAETGLDLSELQLAGSVFRIGGAPERFVGAAQAGEGYHNSSKNPNAGLDAGGYSTYGSSIFAAGIGPLSEDEVPYRNAEGVKRCIVTGGTVGWAVRYLTDDQITQLRLSGARVLETIWAGNYSEDGDTMTYTDWSVSEDVWNKSKYELESGNILPSTLAYDEQMNPHWGDERAIEAVKSELRDFGRGVSVSCNVGVGLNRSTWSVYSAGNQSHNHMVTIVGWDDSYSRDNFGNASGDKPDKDGAWLVKNSWGSETEEFPNGQEDLWGIVEDGKHTGYFWLSYYDTTVSTLESFDFDVNSYGTSDTYYIDQYDYLPEAYTSLRSSKDPISSANIFTAEGDMALRTLGAATYKPNSTVTYQVYLLDDEATTPTDPGHATLVYSIDDLYRYGGYHRVTLPESDWIAMRKGQRYAVVTTQKCNDDGQYYQGAAVNYGKPLDKDVEAFRKSKREEIELSYYDAAYAPTYSECIAAGMSEEIAVAEAKKAGERAVEDAASAINRSVEDAVDTYANKYFVARVNAGESWTSAPKSTWTDGSAGADAQTEWTDWSLITSEIEKSGQMMDNLSVKAFSEVRSFASVSELDSLASALSAAKGVLAAATVSADGADVYACDTWMTQAEHDAAAAAVASAEKLLDAAGDYHDSLASTTPSSDDVAAAAAALAFEAHAGGKAVPTFPDVDYSETGWYADSVGWCAAHGLFAGYPDGTFGVGRSMDRAELATVLWRHFEPEEAAGYDAAAAKADGAVDGVEDGAFYTAAANWAVGAGVIQGFEVEGQDKRDFAPYGELSFEQLVSVVAKASGADYESSDLSVLDGFADKDSVSGWAAHAMAWAVEEGLVSGWDNGAGNARELKPAETVARERAAVVLANAFAAGVLE